MGFRRSNRSLSRVTIPRGQPFSTFIQGRKRARPHRPLSHRLGGRTPRNAHISGLSAGHARGNGPSAKPRLFGTVQSRQAVIRTRDTARPVGRGGSIGQTAPSDRRRPCVSWWNINSHHYAIDEKTRCDKFIEMAREVGASGDAANFEWALFRVETRRVPASHQKPRAYEGRQTHLEYLQSA
jgi:hypothetical protein